MIEALRRLAGLRPPQKPPREAKPKPARKAATTAATPNWPTTVETVAGPVALRVRANSRARRLTMRLCRISGELRMTVPPRTPLAKVDQFIQANQMWIVQQLHRRQQEEALPFEPGAILPFRGGNLRLETTTGRLTRYADGILYVPENTSLYAGRVRRWLSNHAQKLLEAETRELAMQVGRPIQSVKVGDFKTRWGSCIQDGRVAYNWRLIFAPDFVRKSVVAHEVAHLIEANHGPSFWLLATRLYGQPHNQARDWLRQNGSQLMRYGR